ncbi:MAG: HupE/UreJ family protein [Steroidobacteraceae bacterium]
MVFCTLALAGSPAFAHGISPEARQRMIDGGNLEYIRLGAEHMITGYDHLLFLFGVMFFLTRVVDIIKFVSAFTIGHTITLILATYWGITADYYLVDAFIALTVIYIAFQNLDGFRKYLDSGSPNLLYMVLVFGLMHGFGLSTRLQQLPVDESGSMLLHILSFNLGVEIGQIAALLVMLVILRIWQGQPAFPVFAKAANFVLIVSGLLLAGMQLHSYSHTADQESFPISRDDHAHAHVEMQGRGHAHNPDGSHPQTGESASNIPSHD